MTSLTFPHDSRFDQLLGVGRGTATAAQVRRERIIDETGGNVAALLAAPGMSAVVALCDLVEDCPDLAAIPDFDLPWELADRMRAHVYEQYFSAIGHCQTALGFGLANLPIEEYMDSHRGDLIAMVGDGRDHLADRMRAHARHLLTQAFAYEVGSRLYAEEPALRAEPLQGHLRHFNPEAATVLTDSITPLSTFVELARLTDYLAGMSAPSSRTDVLEAIEEGAAALLLGTLDDPGFASLKRHPLP